MKLNPKKPHANGDTLEHLEHLQQEVNRRYKTADYEMEISRAAYIAANERLSRVWGERANIQCRIKIWTQDVGKIPATKARP